MPTHAATIQALIGEFHERRVPELTRREGVLPEVAGKANVLIGMRRSGKTFRLYQEMRRLLGQGVPKSRMLFLNFEDDRLGVPDSATLDLALETFYRMNPDARAEGAYLFFDEIQAVPAWERFARRVLDTERARLYVTGSSARLLSTEVASHFRGRSVTTEVLPFSAREAARAAGHEWADTTPVGAARRSSMDAFIETYLKTGGFPSVAALEPFTRTQVLQEYVDLVVLRDVAERHGSSNLVALRALVAAIFSANAGPFSVSKLHGALVSQGITVTKPTLLAYLDHLVDAYLAFLLPIRTQSARRRTVNPRKVYAVDPGLAAAMYRAGAVNLGAQLENAVYLELRRRYGRLAEGALSYHRTESGREVDFAIDDPVAGGAPALVQVCADMSDPETRTREVTALTEAMRECTTTDATIVTMTESGEVETDAGLVRIVPARVWFFSSPPAGAVSR